MKRFGMLAAMAVVLAASQSMAAMLDQGTREVGLSGDLSDNGDGFDMNLEAFGGYFFMDKIEAGGRVTVAYSDRDDLAAMLLTLGIAGEYNYPVPELPVVPYGGAGVGVGYWSREVDRADNSDMVFILSGWVGAKYFIVESLAIGCQFEVNVATDDIYDDGDSADWHILLRTSYYF